MKAKAMADVLTSYVNTSHIFKVFRLNTKPFTCSFIHSKDSF